eukprot:6478160-Amphidinium_carterae.5
MHIPNFYLPRGVWEQAIALKSHVAMAAGTLLVPSVSPPPEDGCECSHHGLIEVIDLGDNGFHIRHKLTGEVKEIDCTTSIDISYVSDMVYLCFPTGASTPVNAVLTTSVHMLCDSDSTRLWLQSNDTPSRWLPACMRNVKEHVYHDQTCSIWKTVYVFEIPRGPISHATCLWCTLSWLGDVLYGPAASQKHFRRDRLQGWLGKVGWLLGADAAAHVLKKQESESDVGLALIEQTCVTTLFLFLLLACRSNKDERVLNRDGDPMHVVLLRSLCKRYMPRNLSLQVLGVEVRL